MSPQRLTRSQREWRPGQRKTRRSVMVLFGSTTLSLEGLSVFFAGLAMFGLRGRMDGGMPFLLLCTALAAVLIIACAFLTKDWGVSVGWALQLVVIALGFLEPTMFIVGVFFALAWWYGVVQGRRIDRENLQRDAEQRRWEAEHPEA